MRKIFISSSSFLPDDFFVHHLKRDLIEFGFEVVNSGFDEQNEEEQKATSDYWISKADIFIAVITDKSPHVFYNLGYASALGKQVLILTESEYDLPFSLRKYNYLRLDSGNTNAIYNVVNFINKNASEEKSSNDDILSIKELLLNYKEKPQLLDRISPNEFEDFIFNYFLDKRINIKRANSQNDYGFDFVLQDWNGHGKTLIEAKKYNKNSKVSISTIQQLVGAMKIYNADHGIIITTSEFTSSAKAYASVLNKNLELWDINYLYKNFN